MAPDVSCANSDFQDQLLMRQIIVSELGMLARLIALALFGLSDTSHAIGAPPPRVTLKSGVLEGTYFGSAKEVAFLGVPYAAPPIGPLRWKPPQPVQKWSGARQATKFGPAALQLPASWLPPVPLSEDCLYLNVWTTQFSPDAKLPVIVFFHGGGNQAGYSQSTPLGPALSRLGLVIVSANYRLGPFGFFAYPALTAESEHHSSGNYGLLDQLQALRWVRENISQFGGDPERVTVMGQSAGALDICLLMASPLAAGLFQGAILESGEGQSVLNKDIRLPISYNSISGTGEGDGETFVKDLGVSDGPDALEKLRNIPADNILEVWRRNRKVGFDAIVDGWIIPDQPAKVFATGKQINVPVLVGSNADEATVFGGQSLQTVDAYKVYLQKDTGRFANQEFEAYPAMSDAEVPARYLQFQSDLFAYGAYSFARAMTRRGQNAYLYQFTYSEKGKRANLGAYHGEELYFLSDSFPADWEHDGDDEKLGEAIRTYWAQFAKTGNPNSYGLPEWPAYKIARDQYMELGRVVGLRAIPERLRVLEHIMQQVMADQSSQR
jgi:para-nitrobenzyl esterase